jgi:hypothetical protein
MRYQKYQILVFIIFFISCSSGPTRTIGKFQVERDLFLAHFDCKTDVDDLHSVAGVATILSDPRFSEINFHAVAGAYGIQEGLYVPANELFDAAFGSNWSDAHTNYGQALKEVSLIAARTLKNGGNIWIADAGQSDFSADLVKNLKSMQLQINTNQRVHIVQHSDWNESVTSPDNLAFVKSNTAYHKIPDGNAIGNGSPGFKTDNIKDMQNYIKNPRRLHIWQMALNIADKYNGKDERYLNATIANGGLDFSDVSETCWIFGFNHLLNAEEFFREFSFSNIN